MVEVVKTKGKVKSFQIKKRSRSKKRFEDFSTVAKCDKTGREMGIRREVKVS